VFDFLKRALIGGMTETAYLETARHARMLATREGSDGHASAISSSRLRAKRPKSKG
jgi:histidinol dehydrogenase